MATLWMILGSWIWLHGNGLTIYQEKKTNHSQCNPIADLHFRICLTMEVIMVATVEMNPRLFRIQINRIIPQPKQSAFHWVSLGSLHVLVLPCFCFYVFERMLVHPIHGGYHDLPSWKKKHHPRLLLLHQQWTPISQIRRLPPPPMNPPKRTLSKPYIYTTITISC